MAVRGKMPFWEPLSYHTDHLPRQARDKHEKQKALRNKGVFCRPRHRYRLRLQETTDRLTAVERLQQHGLGLHQERQHRLRCGTRLFSTLSYLKKKSDSFTKTGLGQT